MNLFQIDFLPVLLAMAQQGEVLQRPDGFVLLKLAAIAVLVLANAFFVACEFAIVKTHEQQIDELEEERQRKFALPRHVIEHVDEYLSAAQLGVTISSLGLGWLGGSFLAPLLLPYFELLNFPVWLAHAIGFVIVFSLLTVLHVVLGEMVPRTLAIRRPARTTLHIARLLRFFHALFRPLVRLMTLFSHFLLTKIFKTEPARASEIVHSEEELRKIFSESQPSHEMSELGKEIVINVLDMKHRVVRDVMTPRNEVIWIDLEESFEENLKRARDSHHTRLPLCKSDLDHTIGLVHMKDVFLLLEEETLDFMRIKRDILAVPETMSLEKLLALFLNTKAHLALVVDEYGGTVGIVTLDNILAELVGEIHDEFDVQEQEYQKLGEDEFLVDGLMSIYELNDLTGLELESSEVSTIGGYVTHHLGRLPEEQEKVQLEDYQTTVIKTDGRRIVQLHVKRQPVVPAEEGDETAAATEDEK